jgi:hypothetical protein
MRFYLFELVIGSLRKPGSVVEYNQRKPGKKPLFVPGFFFSWVP